MDTPRRFIRAFSSTEDCGRCTAGAVFNLVEEIWSGRIQRGFAAVRPPGHHAEPGRGMGFCLFNNTALGARYLQHRHGLKRIMVVDIDAHHGNGTQAVFYDTDEVLCVSIHQFPGFPGTGKLGETGRGKGEGYTVNVPLGKGHGDNDFLCILHFLVRPLARAYQPEIVLGIARAGVIPGVVIASILDVEASAVEAAFRAANVTRIIHGHTHRPAHHLHEVDGRTCERWVLADWFARGSYLACDASGCRPVDLD